MAKTKEELNALKGDLEVLNKKLAELTTYWYNAPHFSLDCTPVE